MGGDGLDGTGASAEGAYGSDPDGDGRMWPAPW